jgi:hypothetical protein
MSEDPNLDPRIFNRVSLFWRELIGEKQYHTYQPKELFRWYNALEVMGFQNVRRRLEERRGKHGLRQLNGIVPYAPHPPVELVEAWLTWHEAHYGRLPLLPITIAVMFALMLAGCELSGCTLTQPMTNLVAKPPVPVAGGVIQPPQQPELGITLPANQVMHLQAGAFSTGQQGVSFNSSPPAGIIGPTQLGAPPATQPGVPTTQGSTSPN